MTTPILTIPLTKLTPSPANARKTGAGSGLEELAASIATHGLLQNLQVRPVLDGEGQETGRYEVVAGARRLAAMKLLAKQKRLPKGFQVPCAVIAGADPGEVSLAENVVREPMHPADQALAFARLAEEGGLGAEEIAARFGVTPAVVRQRLRLGAASPRLIELYREGGLTLDQLTAFCLTDDHTRQEQALEALSWNRDPWMIRRLLTEGRVPARDRRARYVGVEAYEAAGGTVLRDLFTEDGGGWLEDAGLLDRLALRKLEEAAAELQAREGWRWVQATIDFPHAHGLRRVYPRIVERSAGDETRLAALVEEQEALAMQHDGVLEGDLPPEVASRAEELAREIDALSGPAYAYEPDEIARGGAFVSLGHDGNVRIERGFVRPEDEPAPAPVAPSTDEEAPGAGHVPQAGPTEDGPETVTAPASEEAEPDGPGLPDRLLLELTAHRTAGLRDALAQAPEMALRAVVHALVVRLFFRGYGVPSCLEIEPRSTGLETHAPGLADGPAAQSVALRHEAWARRLPREADELWACIAGLDGAELIQLLAHCASLTVNALRLPWDRRPQALAHADALAAAAALDMTAYWAPTERSYLGRVTKARILEAVREAISEEAAERLSGLKKQPMAEAAEQLLAGTGWLPEVLRTRGELLEVRSPELRIAAE